MYQSEKARVLADAMTQVFTLNELHESMVRLGGASRDTPLGTIKLGLMVAIDDLIGKKDCGGGK
jgi:hypothetical protein